MTKSHSYHPFARVAQRLRKSTVMAHIRSRGHTKPSANKPKQRTDRSAVMYTKKKLNQGVFEERGGSDSRFSHGQRPVPKQYWKLVKVMPKMFQVQTGYLQVDSGSAGLQATQNITQLVNYADLNQMFLQAGYASSNSATTLPQNYKTQKLFVRSAGAEILLTNTTNYQCQMFIYDCIARRDVKSGADPTSLFQTGFADESYVTGGAYVAPNINVIGSTPFQSDAFTSYWKVNKITTTKLAGGQFHTHHIKWKCNRAFDYEVIQNSPQGFFKGLSTCTFVIIYGAPVPSNVLGQPTTERAQLDVVYTKRFDYGFIQNNTTGVAQYNYLNATALATNGIINEAQEKVDTFVTNG